MKKTICLLLAAVLLAGLCGCAGKGSALPGTGTPGETASLDWSGYDALIEKARNETDMQKRSELFHQAEELLLYSGAVIPLFRGKANCLVKSDVSGVYQASTCDIFFDRIRREGASADQPLQICVCGEPGTLDAALKTSSEVFMIVRNTFAGLLRENAEGQYVCDLAERYERSDDGLTYTFHLRPDLKWSDGSPLSAEDFVYSWQRAAAKQTGAEAGDLFDCIKGYPDDLELTVTDNGQTLTVVLAQPCAYFPALCSKPSFAPVCRRQVEGAEGYRDAAGKVVNPGAWATDGNMVTCGAYTIGQWKHNESLVLKKNPYYYDAQNVFTQTVNLMLTSDAATAYNAYAADSVVLTRFIPEDLAESLRNSPEYRSKSTLGLTLVGFNVRSPLFAGMTAEEAATFRRAIGCAIDRTFLCTIACSKNAIPAVSVVPPEMQDGTGKTFGEGCAYEKEDGYFSEYADPDRARELLRSIGFQFDGNGRLKEPIAVEYMFNPANFNPTVAACLQADLECLGIRLILSQREWGVFFGERKQAKAESFRDAWVADFNDPYAALGRYTSGSANNILSLGK